MISTDSMQTPRAPDCMYGGIGSAHDKTKMMTQHSVPLQPRSSIRGLHKRPTACKSSSFSPTPNFANN